MNTTNLNTMKDLQAENTRLQTELKAIIAAVNDAIDTDATTAPAAVNELIDYHFYMVNGMQADCNRLKAYIATLEAIEASKDWIPAIGDRVRMIAGTGHTRHLIGYAKITEITNPHDSHPYRLHADDDLSPMLWSTRDGIVKA